MEGKELFDRITDSRVTDLTPNENIVRGIYNDINGRKGLGNEWEEIDEDIQIEIISKWMKIVELGG